MILTLFSLRAFLALDILDNDLQNMISTIRHYKACDLYSLGGQVPITVTYILLNI